MHKLSPSTLAIFSDCPRCFWLHFNRKIRRPDGIVASIPNGMDKRLKEWADGFRNSLPAQFSNDSSALLNGCVFLPGAKEVRKRKTCIIGEVELTGFLDDVLLEADQRVTPFDWKTRASPPGEAPPYYIQQLNLYALLLERNGYHITSRGVLCYVWPRGVLSATNHLNFNFGFELVEVQTNTRNAEKIVLEAADCLAGSMPAAGEECEYCAFVNVRADEVLGITPEAV